MKKTGGQKSRWTVPLTDVCRLTVKKYTDKSCFCKSEKLTFLDARPCSTHTRRHFLSQEEGTIVGWLHPTPSLMHEISRLLRSWPSIFTIWTPIPRYSSYTVAVSWLAGNLLQFPYTSSDWLVPYSSSHWLEIGGLSLTPSSHWLEMYC